MSQIVNDNKSIKELETRKDDKTVSIESVEPVKPTEVKKAPVMYLLVNDDLKMGKGKIAAQVGHAVQLIVQEILIKSYEDPMNKEAGEDFQQYKQWNDKSAYAKVVLRATEKELRELIANETKCRYVIDAGRTQIAPNSLTVVGFFPRDDLADKMKKFKLHN